MHPGPAAALVTQAQLTYRGGPLLGAVEVVTAFWGAEWLADEAPLLTQINDFFLYILDSPLIDQLGEYSVPDTQIGHGSLAGTEILTDTQPGSTVTDADIQNLIQTEIANTKLPTSSANSLYYVYLPPGVTVDLGGQLSCSAFCGYHDSIGGSIYYAVMPYPDCAGCVGGLHLLDALTSTSSHELCEAVTDPVPGQGWYDDTNGEIGDICSWQTRKLGNWTVQLEWSNQQGTCI
ncbi:MAG: hypothetical protein AUH32_04250 [Actinobacteria bacterium 13_1_40CM_66_12]|nr:MAG: hypothetical protein AUH32_04250 [Actinobacteria bacterium 13_1_40CM_66_12]